VLRRAVSCSAFTRRLTLHLCDLTAQHEFGGCRADGTRHKRCSVLASVQQSCSGLSARSHHCHRYPHQALTPSLHAAFLTSAVGWADTANFSPEQKKGTPLDEKVFAFLASSAGLEWGKAPPQSTAPVGAELLRLRSDCSTLPTALLLLKDGTALVLSSIVFWLAIHCVRV
jgi:hypothetical protein